MPTQCMLEVHSVYTVHGSVSALHALEVCGNLLLQTEGVPILASFLRKNQRALKLSTLQCLDVLVQNYGEFFVGWVLAYLYCSIFVLMS